MELSKESIKRLFDSEQWDWILFEDKATHDKREGDIEVNLSTIGCGCCAAAWDRVVTFKEAKLILEAFITNQEKQFAELRRMLDNAEEKVS